MTVWLWASVAWACLADGAALRADGDHGAAEAAFLACGDTAPVWSEVGVTRAWSGDLKGAEAAYRRAVALDAEHLASVVGLARVLGWQGRFRDAEGLLLAVPTHTPERNTTLAGVYRAQRRLRAADAVVPRSENPELATDARGTVQVMLGASTLTGPAGTVSGSWEHGPVWTWRGTAGMGVVPAGQVSTPTRWSAQIGGTAARQGWWVTPQIWATAEGAGGDLSVARALGNGWSVSVAGRGGTSPQGWVWGQRLGLGTESVRMLAFASQDPQGWSLATLGRLQVTPGRWTWQVMAGPEVGSRGNLGIATTQLSRDVGRNQVGVQLGGRIGWLTEANAQLVWRASVW